MDAAIARRAHGTLDAQTETGLSHWVEDDRHGKSGDRGRFISNWAPKRAPPVFLLTTTGRRSGKSRTVALSYMTDADETPITVGTYGGLPTEPAWVLNLRANPEAVMQVDGTRTVVTASFIEGPEWSSTWERILTEYPLYKDALATVDRDVPIIRLQPQQHDAPST